MRLPAEPRTPHVSISARGLRPILHYLSRFSSHCSQLPNSDPPHSWARSSVHSRRLCATSTTSTSSTATGTHRGNESRRRSPSSEAVRGYLEMRLQDLKRDWDAYKTGRSGAPRHRRSRSASSLPSSAVTIAEPDGFHLALLRRSPRARRLVSSLQQTGSADAPAAGPCDNEDASSVDCSVEGGYSVATYSSSSSCPCPSQCAVVCCGYSTSSSCTGTTVAPFSSYVSGGCARKMDEGKWAASRAVWISAIALVVVGFVAMIILVLGVNEGRIEYQVPT